MQLGQLLVATGPPGKPADRTSLRGITLGVKVRGVRPLSQLCSALALLLGIACEWRQKSRHHEWDGRGGFAPGVGLVGLLTGLEKVVHAGGDAHEACQRGQFSRGQRAKVIFVVVTQRQAVNPHVAGQLVEYLIHQLVSANHCGNSDSKLSRELDELRLGQVVEHGTFGGREELAHRGLQREAVRCLRQLRPVTGPPLGLSLPSLGLRCVRGLMWQGVRPRDWREVRASSWHSERRVFSVVWWLLKLLIFGPLLLLVRAWSRLRLGRKQVVRIALGRGRRPSDHPGDLHESLRLMRHLVTDDAVRGVVIDVRDVSGGQATLQELRDAMLKLRAEGRAVFVHVHTLGWRELLLASAADRVWMTPCGEAFLTGMGARITYYGPALERLGAKADLVAVGRFKTFGEPYLRGHPSRANRTQLEELLGDLQEQVFEMVADARGLEVEDLRALLGRAPLSADELLEAGLIDAVQYPDTSSELAQELLGSGWRIVPARVFARLTFGAEWLRTRLRRRPRVAVVHLRGPIVQGGESLGGRGVRIDSDEVVPALLALSNDPEIKGVVLAVSSPGGSALASDLIARVVQRMIAHKPVVAAFGDYAASGGYYLAAPASEIVARPGTITGSIGVVGGKVVVGKALSRLGIHSETVEVGPDSGFLGPFESFNHSQRRRFMASLQRAYTRFLGIVAGGRRLPVRAVEPHAAGRVWTGRQALERGLVDHLGGLDLALERLNTKMPTSQRDAEVLHVTFEPSRFEALQRLATGGVQLWLRDAIDDAVLTRMGRGGLMVRYAMARPTEPLALLPWDIND